MKIVLMALVSIIIFSVSTLFALAGNVHALYAGNCIYLVATIFLIKFCNIPSKYVLLIILLPVLVLQLPIQIIDFRETYASLPRTLGIVIAVGAGKMFMTKSDVKTKLLIVVLNIGIILTIGFKVYPLILNKERYGSYSQIVKESVPNFTFFTEEKRPFSNNDIKNKTLLFCFWFSKCAVCYGEFPLLDSINKLETFGSLEIYALNIPIGEEKIESNFGKLKSIGYRFGNLYAPYRNANEIFNVYSYPTTIVIKNDKIVFRGDLDNAYQYYNDVLK